MTIILYISSIIISLSLTLCFKPRLISLLREGGMVVKNYWGKDLVSGAGLVLLLPLMVSLLPLRNIIGRDNMMAYICMLLSMALAGYLDDSLGGNRAKGFKGHLKGLLKGHISTGIMKIIFALITGFILSGLYFSNPWDMIFHTLLFSLCVNIINLLDLRPGRAIKSFMAILIIPVLSSGSRNIWILLPVLAGLMVYTGDELKEIYMLGDTGSNLLGGILGFYMIKSPPSGVKYAFFLILGLLNLVSEFRSFSKIIESVPLLRRMDKLGQLKKERS